MEISIVSGGFDPVHPGHINLFKEAKKLFPKAKLWVLLNSDRWLINKKGTPFMVFSQREKVIKSIKYIDGVLPVNDSDGTVIAGLQYIKKQYPNAVIRFLNGGDRKEDNIPEVSVCLSLDIEIVNKVGGYKTQSSSSLLTKFKNLTVERTWGYFTILASGKNFKVKELYLNSGCSISLQRHLKRSEHWTVVEGTAHIIKGTKKYEAFPNMSFYIPIGTIHKLSNNSQEPLKIIEVQVGEYLGEDDIIRYD